MFSVIIWPYIQNEYEYEISKLIHFLMLVTHVGLYYRLFETLTHPYCSVPMLMWSSTMPCSVHSVRTFLSITINEPCLSLFWLSYILLMQHLSFTYRRGPGADTGGQVLCWSSRGCYSPLVCDVSVDNLREMCVWCSRSSVSYCKVWLLSRGFYILPGFSTRPSKDYFRLITSVSSNDKVNNVST